MEQQINQQEQAPSSSIKPKRKIVKKYYVLLVIVLAVIIGGIAFAYSINNDVSSDVSAAEGDVLGISAEVIVPTQIVAFSPVASEISLSGTTRPLDEVKVSPKMSGRLAGLYVKEGDFVSVGQTIAQIEQDQTLLANYNTAQNNYQIAQQNLDNTILSTQKDIEAAEIGIAIAQESLTAARNAQDNTSDQTNTDLANTYETAKQNSDAALLTVNNTLTTIKNILDNHAAKEGNTYLSFPTADLQSFNDLMMSYPTAETDYDNTLTYYNSIKYSGTQAEIDELLAKVIATLDKTSFALEDMRQMLSYGTTYSQMSATQLETAKGNVYAAQAAVNGSLSGIQAIRQAIASLKIGSSTASDSVQSAVELAQKQLEAAQKSLASVHAKTQIQINSTRMQVESALGQLNAITAQLGNATVISPIAGTVNQKFVNVGEMVMAGTPLVTVVNTSSIEIEIGITEFDIGKINIGQQAKVKLAAYEDKEFLGNVYYVSIVADASKKFPVKIQLDNKDGQIKAGMVADIKIITDTQEEAIVIPKIAVFDESGKEKVYVINDFIVEVREVNTQPINDNEVRVVVGLTAGEEIVSNGNFDLKDGDLIVVEE